MIGRDAIVAALATVDGLSSSPTRPDTVVAGAAWPAWASTRWLNMRGDGPRERRWFVFVVLNGTALAGAVAEGDPLVEMVGQALADIQLRVELVEPVGVQVADTAETMPALRFTLAD